MRRPPAQPGGLNLSPPAPPAAAVTAIVAPEGLDSGAIVKELKSRFASVIANGQGTMKGKIFRVAHLGYFDFMDTIALIGALEQIAPTVLKTPNFQFGQALAAAQKVYADHMAAAKKAASPELVNA